MAGVLADLAVAYEAAVALVMAVSVAFDAEDAAGRAYARLAVALAKYLLTKRCPAFVVECLECHGGNGYVEDGPLARLYREAPLNAIWEGSSNVIALDVLRTLQREPLALEASAAALMPACATNGAFTQAADVVIAAARRAWPEAGARHLVERLALVLQGALLLRHAPTSVADVFCATRLHREGGCTYGASLGIAAASRAILARHATA